jgi:hypothetical protein
MLHVCQERILLKVLLPVRLVHLGLSLIIRRQCVVKETNLQESDTRNAPVAEAEHIRLQGAQFAVYPTSTPHYLVIFALIALFTLPRTAIETHALVMPISFR